MEPFDCTSAGPPAQARGPAQGRLCAHYDAGGGMVSDTRCEPCSILVAMVRVPHITPSTPRAVPPPALLHQPELSARLSRTHALGRPGIEHRDGAAQRQIPMSLDNRARQGLPLGLAARPQDATPPATGLMACAMGATTPSRCRRNVLRGPAHRQSTGGRGQERANARISCQFWTSDRKYNDQCQRNVQLDGAGNGCSRVDSWHSAAVNR